MAPELVKAADSLNKVKNLVIARMDATANEVEGVSI